MSVGTLFVVGLVAEGKEGDQPTDLPPPPYLPLSYYLRWNEKGGCETMTDKEKNT